MSNEGQFRVRKVWDPRTGGLREELVRTGDAPKPEPKKAEPKADAAPKDEKPKARTRRPRLKRSKKADSKNS